MADVISYEVEGRVGIVKYNNAPLNIMTMDTLAQLHNQLEQADKDPATDVVVMTMELQKEGRIFSAGMNLDDMLETKLSTDYTTKQYCDESKSYFGMLARMEKPVIYAFDSNVIGGAFEMSLYADFRIGGEHLKLTLSEISLGIIPGGGGTQTLTRLVGPSKAKEIILTARTLRAEEAKELGIVNQIVPSDQLREKTLEFANQMAQYSGPALKAAKASIDAAITSELATGLNIETDIFRKQFETDDATEGIRAFKEKRDAEYPSKQ